MEQRMLKQLLIAAARPTADVNFTDAQSAAKNAILEHFGLEDISIRDIKKHSGAIFAIVEEVLEEVLPMELESLVGQFAEIKTFGRDESPKFTIRGVGKNRVMRGIVKGARGGLYRARRLDNKELMVPVSVWTVGYQITLEELLTGRRTIAELVELIAKGFTELIYTEVIAALRASKAYAPVANRHEANGINEVELRRIIRTVSAYGNPTIIAFQSEAEKLTNTAGNVSVMNPNVAAADLDEIRNQGRVSVYRGTPIIVLPNYFMDETNEDWLFDEADIFVLPVGEKPVKVAFQGEMYTTEVAQPHGGVEYHAHRMMGIGIMFYNHIGIYTDAVEEGS